MGSETVNKIQQAILENPDIHTNLFSVLKELENKVGGHFSFQDLAAALKSNVSGPTAKGNTHDYYWAEVQQQIQNK